ncbi:MAG: hypothetical protein Q7R32_12210 [Dehalococcoidia bacterium]|nr:hypothetical protein [Dehalococcoidia bacterium]
MDAEMMYRTKLQEIEREVRRMRLLAAAREATCRRDDSAARRCPSIPLRLLRALRPAS